MCVYKPVNIYVCAYYIHKTLYFYIQYAFIIQIIKMGEGFCFFFLIGEEILKTRNWILLTFGGVFLLLLLFFRFLIFFIFLFF